MMRGEQYGTRCLALGCVGRIDAFWQGLLASPHVEVLNKVFKHFVVRVRDCEDKSSPEDSQRYLVR